MDWTGLCPSFLFEFYFFIELTGTDGVLFFYGNKKGNVFCWTRRICDGVMTPGRVNGKVDESKASPASFCLFFFESLFFFRRGRRDPPLTQNKCNAATRSTRRLTAGTSVNGSALCRPPEIKMRRRRVITKKKEQSEKRLMSAINICSPPPIKPKPLTVTDETTHEPLP